MNSSHHAHIALQEIVMRDLENKQALLDDTLDGICKPQGEDVIEDSQVVVSSKPALLEGSLTELEPNGSKVASEIDSRDGLKVGSEDQSLLELDKYGLDGDISDVDFSLNSSQAEPALFIKNQTDLGFSAKLGGKTSSKIEAEKAAQDNIDGHSLLSSDAELGLIKSLPDVAKDVEASEASDVDEADDAVRKAELENSVTSELNALTQEEQKSPQKLESSSQLTRSRDKLELGSILDHRYRIKDILGEGGFGVVYDALDLENSDRRVAIKTLRRTIADYEQAAKRFEREVILSQSIESQHAVKIFASGVTEDGIHYFVMEYIEGYALDLYLDRYRKLSLFDTKMMLLQILDALAEAHQKDIVHRDLKPSNIVFSKKGEEGEFFVKVLDFGIAKVISDASDLAGDEKLTQTGAWMGSPAYMSPEHLAGRSLTASSDIYAIGLIAIEMLTGRMAIEGDTPMEIAVYQMSSNEVSIPDWLLETSLGPIVSKCVKKKSDQRYQDASELRDALLSVNDDVLKNEYVGVKMRRFTSDRKVKSGDTDVGVSNTPNGLNPTHSLILSPEDAKRRQMQIVLIVSIIICMVVIVIFVVLKTYIDRSYLTDAEPETSVALKTHEAKLLQGAALGVFGGIELPRARVTIVSNPSDAQVVRASDGVVIGKSGDTFDVVRSSTTWDLIIRAEGYVDFELPVVPIQRRENFTLTLLPMPKTEAVVGGVPKLPELPAVETKSNDAVDERVAPTKRPSSGSKKPPKSNVGQWLLE